MTRKIDISHKTVFFITAFLALLWALYQVRDVIILLFISIIFMSALSPVVEFLGRKFKLPRSLSIAVSYLFVLTFLISLISVVILPLIDETTKLIQAIPTSLDRLAPAGIPIDTSIIQDQLGNLSRNLLNFSLVIFNNFIAFISVAVLTFYLLLEKNRVDNLIAEIFVGKEKQAKVTFLKIQEKLGAWMRGQLALSLIIGGLTYLVLLVLGVPYALPLAIIAGILEVVPVIGPIISAIPSVLIALLISPALAALVAGAFFVIQQLENNLIVPQVMKKAVGLNPIIVILAVAIGGKLLGIAGALLAVPITVVVQVILMDVINVDGRIFKEVGEEK